MKELLNTIKAIKNNYSKMKGIIDKENTASSLLDLAHLDQDEYLIIHLHCLGKDGIDKIKAILNEDRYYNEDSNRYVSVFKSIKRLHELIVFFASHTEYFTKYFDFDTENYKKTSNLYCQINKLSEVIDSTKEELTEIKHSIKHIIK